MNEYQITEDNEDLALSTDEVNEHLKTSITDITKDALMSLLVKAVESFGENYTKRFFTIKTVQTYRNFWGPSYCLERSPFVAIKSVTYNDVDNASQTVAASNYYVNYSSFYTGLFFDGSVFSFPALADRPQSILINFTAGYASDYEEMPKDLKAAMLNHLALVWENRGDCTGTGVIANFDFLYKNLPSTSRMIYDTYTIKEISL